MGHKHHHCDCQHENVKYCKVCHVVHCLNCNKEWGSSVWQYTYTPYYTLGGNSYLSNAVSTKINSSTTAVEPICNHGNE